MKKYLLVLLLIVFIVPSVALASWYNPFSWFNNWSFHKTEITTENPAQKITIPNTTTTNETSNKVIIPPALIKPNTLPVAKKTTSQKDTIQPKQFPQVVPSVVTSPQQPIVSGCTSIQGYSASTGISCSGDNSCISGSFFDKNTGSCINYLTYCQKQNGSNASYDSINNNCVCKTGYVINSAGTGCEIPQVNNGEQQTQNPKLDSLKSQFTQIINDINTDCQNADAGHPVAVCELTESKLQTVLEQEAAIGISKQEAAPQLSALQDAYNRLQTEYYSEGMRVADNQYILGTQANVAAEMQILANYKAMFTN